MSAKLIHEYGLYGVEDKNDWIKYRNNYLKNELLGGSIHTEDNIYAEDDNNIYIDFDNIIDYIPADIFFEEMDYQFEEDPDTNEDDDEYIWLENNLYELVMTYLDGGYYTQLEFDDDGSVLSIEDY